MYRILTKTPCSFILRSKCQQNTFCHWNLLKSSSKINNLFFQRSAHFSFHRHCSTTQDKQSEFIMFYRYPYIVHAKVFNRIKVYQTCIAAVIAPVMWGVYFFTDYMPLSNAFAMTVVSGVAISMMLLMGRLSQRLVGIMYLDKSRETLKVAHLTFWGRRQEFTVPVSNVVPLSDMKINPKNIFSKLSIFDQKKNYYFDTRFGVIVDVDMFEHVFGSTEVLKIK